MSNQVATITITDIEKMATAIAASKMFGVTTKEQAMALMLIAQAEGTHPALAARDYHVFQGKASLKADTMLARFQQSGGKVQWDELTDSRVCATFTHAAGGSATIDWDMNRAKTAQLGGKDMWKKFPRQMLRARVISEGIRTVFPGVVQGFYTPEEVSDFVPDRAPMIDVTEPQSIDEVGEVVERVFATFAEHKRWSDNLRADLQACTTEAELQIVFKGAEAVLTKMKNGNHSEQMDVNSIRTIYKAALERVKETAERMSAINEQLTPRE